MKTISYVLFSLAVSTNKHKGCKLYARPKTTQKKPGLLRRRLANPEVRDRNFRIFSITLILIVVEASAVLMLAYVMELEVLVVAFSGVLAMALAFYLFMHLWPDRPEPALLTSEEAAGNGSETDQGQGCPSPCKGDQGIAEGG